MEFNGTQEMNDFLEALRGLRSAVLDLKEQEVDTKHALTEVVNNSYLKSTLTLLNHDIGLRRVLELTR